MDNPLSSFHRTVELSTEIVDNSTVLWIKGPDKDAYKNTNLIRLWINLWIRGVETVDKSVDRIVDNWRLWITWYLSTICPQRNVGYPQFYPQASEVAFGLGNMDLGGYPHIHRPYYYY